MQNVGLWSLTNRWLVANLLFSTNHGIGLSAWRFNLAAGFDPTVQSGSKWQNWRTENGFLVSSNHYDWNRQPGQRWFLSAAKASGIDQFIAMVYSPPTNYTRNGFVYCTDGLGSSNLKPGHEPALASYIADVLAYFRTNPAPSERISFNHVMPVNEPYWEWNGSSQEGCRYANSDLIPVAQALHNALAARNLQTEIVLSEAGSLQGLYQTQTDISGKYGRTYGNYLYTLNSVTNIISRNISAHSYWTDNPATELVQIRKTLKTHLDANPFWRYWQSEYCILGTDGPKRDLTMTTALKVARVIWADLAVADAAAWHWWLSLSQADYKDGLLFTDYWSPGDEESVYCSKNFWAFGQWSRFIRPGWKRVEMNGYTNVNGLMAAAFVAPATNAAAIVVVNASGVNQPVAPNISGLGPGLGISSWSPWITSAAPSDNLSPLPTFVAGESCTVPANAVVTFVATIENSNAAPALVFEPLADRKAEAGQALQVVLHVWSSNAPASLLSIQAYSDDADLMPGSGITVSPSSAAGTIIREVFTGFSGTGLAKLAAAPFFPSAPALVTSQSTFECPENVGGRFGTRLLGYVVPPATGEYTFWIASRDASQLFLSSDANPANKSLVASVTNYTAPQEWTKEAGQQSGSIKLVGGKRYFIEAVHTASTGSDHLSVGWQLPDGTLERPIPGNRLAKWTDPRTNAAEHLLTLAIPPNQAGTAKIRIVATDPLGRKATNSFNLTVSTNTPSANLKAELDQGNLRLTWPADHIGWDLEVQTNSLARANWSRIPGAGGTNWWTVPIDPSLPAVFYRLAL